MSRDVREHIDHVVAASVPKAAKALTPVLRDVVQAVESSDGYDAADAALRQLEGKARADGLEPILNGAMMQGTSVGGIDE